MDKTSVPKLIIGGLTVASSLAIADLVNTAVETYVPKSENRLLAKAIYTSAVVATTFLVTKQIQDILPAESINEDEDTVE